MLIKLYKGKPTFIYTLLVTADSIYLLMEVYEERRAEMREDKKYTITKQL